MLNTTTYSLNPSSVFCVPIRGLPKYPLDYKIATMAMRMNKAKKVNAIYLSRIGLHYTTYLCIKIAIASFDNLSSKKMKPRL